MQLFIDNVHIDLHFCYDDLIVLEIEDMHYNGSSLFEFYVTPTIKGHMAMFKFY
jgi:hypothetical protein